jgi:hypothetical protein
MKPVYCRIIFTKSNQIIVEFESGNHYIFSYHFFKLIDSTIQYLGITNDNPFWLRYQITKEQLKPIREYAKKQWGIPPEEICESETIEEDSNPAEELLKDWF